VVETQEIPDAPRELWSAQEGIATQGKNRRRDEGDDRFVKGPRAATKDIYARRKCLLPIIRGGLKCPNSSMTVARGKADAVSDGITVLQSVEAANRSCTGLSRGLHERPNPGAGPEPPLLDEAIQLRRFWPVLAFARRDYSGWPGQLGACDSRPEEGDRRKLRPIRESPALPNI